MVIDHADIAGGLKQMNDIYDGQVTLKVRGIQPLRWEYPTSRELVAILEDVEDKIKKGVEVDEFEFRKYLRVN